MANVRTVGLPNQALSGLLHAASGRQYGAGAWLGRDFDIFDLT